MKVNCRICGEDADGRNINLYVDGSEGLTICHSCEMILVESVRNLMQVGSRARMQGYKACKIVRGAKGKPTS
jgi:ribosome-binding protein aMBF1 (putative translation factor)